MNRIAKAEQLCAKFDERGNIKELLCKGCGMKIAGMVLSDREPTHVAIGDNLVAVTPVEFVHLSAYREVLMEFDDRSAHTTYACGKCVAEVKMMDDEEEIKAILEDWYIQDVAVWRKEIELTGGGKISDRQLNRNPVRIV